MSAQQERTEKATSRRRQKAKDQGQFAYSQEVTSALTLIASLVSIFYFLSAPAGFRDFFSSVLQVVTKGPDSEQMLLSVARQAGIYFLVASAPVFIAATAAALVGNFLQGLPIFAPEAAGLKWERLNPIQGFSRLKTKVSPLEWGKILLLVVVGVILWKTVAGFWEQLVSAPARPIESSNQLIHSVLLQLLTDIGLTVAILAAGDFFLQRWRFEKSIKQSKAEVKEDNKAMEGNPAIKGKIRSIQRERARRRMMSRVKDADVIVTNPTHFAVALEYKPERMGAPRVIAKGQDFVAQKIKEKGREYDIPTVENVPLARALYRSVEVEQEIPMDLYKAVAEVLAYVYRIRKQL